MRMARRDRGELSASTVQELRRYRPSCPPSPPLHRCTLRSDRDARPHRDANIRHNRSTRAAPTGWNRNQKTRWPRPEQFPIASTYARLHQPSDPTRADRERSRWTGRRSPRVEEKPLEPHLGASGLRRDRWNQSRRKPRARPSPRVSAWRRRPCAHDRSDSRPDCANSASSTQVLAMIPPNAARIANDRLMYARRSCQAETLACAARRSSRSRSPAA